MDTANPILGNPLLLAAILLLLAILPRALRQNKKTALDRAVERFEREELKAAAEGKSDENKNKLKKPVPLKDGSLAYLKTDQPGSQNTEEEEFGGIPPFPAQQEEDKKVKIVKPGVPISHYETAEPAPKKKVKLIKQDFSIAPDKSKASSKKSSTDPLKEKPSEAPANTPIPAGNEDFPLPPVTGHEESKDNWIEAEIPGLTVEPPPEEKPDNIPVFNAFPKEERQPAAEKPQKSPGKEKRDVNIKNIAPETEEKKDSKSETPAPIKTGSPERETEISESKVKEVEIKAPVVSHKNVAKKGTETPETKAPSSKAEKSEESEIEGTTVPPSQDTTETSRETAKLKPFLLDLRYLDPEGMETENSNSYDELPADLVDVTISRLNALQVDLENQLAPKPDKAAPGQISIDESMRKDRTQESLPDLEETINRFSDKKEVSLEELDSFLFTATQRKKRE